MYLIELGGAAPLWDWTEADAVKNFVGEIQNLPKFVMFLGRRSTRRRKLRKNEELN
jgi:hypothetical protein